MKPLQHIEIHVTHACNLACESCSHYSNHHHKGVTSLETADEWMGLWSKRVAPKLFSLIGGEPAIHPQLTEFMALARRHWPTSDIRIVTNGFLMHHHPDLPLLMGKDPKMFLHLSDHHPSEEFQEKFRPGKELLMRWQRQHGVKVEWGRSFSSWTRRYKGEGSAIEPFEDENPEKSWQICTAKGSPQLHEGALWKCAPITYLRMQHEKYGLSEKWNPYLAYKPLLPGCSDVELDDFFARDAEGCCRMCSATLEHFKLPNPIPVQKTIAIRSWSGGLAEQERVAQKARI